jgi:hypothetical protein
MTITTNIIRNVAGAAAVLVLLAGAADAQTRLKAVDPQPGQCKTTAETNFGGSPQQAQMAWEYAVKAKYGLNWSRWPAAQNKVVMQNGSPTNFLAQGRPCFTYPVQ